MAFTLDSRDSVVPTSRAQIHTSDIRALTDGIAGIGVLSGCAVSAQSTPDRTVAVASGSIQIAGGTTIAVSANAALSCGTADSTNPRWLLITSSASGVPTVTAGTPAASPDTAKPNVPSGHVLLATVYDPASNATVIGTQITDKRVTVPTVAGVFPSAPTLVESVAWVSKSDGATISLASTPVLGDVIFVAQISNDFAAKLPTGGGVTTWYPIGTQATGGGVVGNATIWFGVVDGTPSTTITLHWTSNNTQYAALANFRGLKGRIENSDVMVATPASSNHDAIYNRGLTSVRSPLFIGLYFTRNSTPPTVANVTAMQTGTNIGWQDFFYALSAQFATTFAYITGTSSEFVLITALVY